MPKLSDDTLLDRALTPAALDRESFADAYSREGPEADEALELVEKIRAIKGRRLAKLSAEEREVARLTFIFAEQWEFGLGDAQASKSEKKLAFRRAKASREVRLRLWGGTEYEQICREAQSIEIFPRNAIIDVIGKNEPR